MMLNDTARDAIKKALADTEVRRSTEQRNMERLEKEISETRSQLREAEDRIAELKKALG